MGPSGPVTPVGRTRYDRTKRLLDVVLAILLLLVASPVMLAVAVVIAVTLGRPVLFRQARPGRHGELFELVKFRTMRPVDVAGGVVTDRDRLTRLGRRLRATSMDELPTLWNVVRGEMSLVGPRPLLVDYLDRYTPAQARRHEVRPGITGLAQVRGRNAMPFPERFAHDVWYVDNRSLRMDLHILVETVGAVLHRRGITAPGNPTMPEFLGNPTMPEFLGGTELPGQGGADHDAPAPSGPDGRTAPLGDLTGSRGAAGHWPADWRTG
ncbi:sugar transferase [Plantactinospora sp. S1510]|uniref:Sugar transferase n=1 Tax=Plantactinospora alkalitolerans TaxID=2789879 RepID=A0ABS0GXG2_9ACTN|nr:sugar transferase [Plantactinospora alkalitolerans]